MDLQKLTNILEQFALEVPALISDDLKGIPKPNSLIAACAVISAVWEGRGTHSTHLVKLSTIMSMYSLPASVRGKGPKKS